MPPNPLHLEIGFGLFNFIVFFFRFRLISYGSGAGTREGSFAGGFPPEVSEVPSKEEVAILIMLKKEFTGLTASQLARFLRRLYPELSKKQRQKKVHRILDKLEEKGFVKTEKIGNFRFAKITLSGVLFLAKNADEVDSIKSTEVYLNLTFDDIQEEYERVWER